LLLKDRIIHESLRLFSLKGFLSTSIEDILRHANTSKGGFYNHFKSKDDLFLAVLQEAQRFWRDKVLVGLDQIDSPSDKIKKLLNNYSNNYLKDPECIPGGCVFLTLSVELANQRPEHANMIYAGFTSLKNLIRRLLDEARERNEIGRQVDPEQASDVLFAGLLGTSVIHALNKSEALLDRSIHSMVVFLDNLKE